MNHPLTLTLEKYVFKHLQMGCAANDHEQQQQRLRSSRTKVLGPTMLRPWTAHLHCQPVGRCTRLRRTTCILEERRALVVVAVLRPIGVRALQLAAAAVAGGRNACDTQV